MKSIFDGVTRAGLVHRIKHLNTSHKAHWGKMNLSQMLEHARLWDEWVQGESNHKRLLIGRILGKMMLKKALKDEAPLRRNTPTIAALILRHSGGDLESQKREWIERIEKYESYSNLDFVHVFFGKMTKEQIGCFVYKHIDHHLRQFGV